MPKFWRPLPRASRLSLCLAERGGVEHRSRHERARPAPAKRSENLGVGAGRMRLLGVNPSPAEPCAMLDTLHRRARQGRAVPEIAAAGLDEIEAKLA